MILEMDELFEDIDQGTTSSYVPKTSGATSKATTVSNMAQGWGSTYLFDYKKSWSKKFTPSV